MEKEASYHGKTTEELKKMDLQEFAKLAPARQRRTLLRGATKEYKQLIDKINRTQEGTFKKPIKTHARDMVAIPNMLGLTIHIHNGKTFSPIMITEDMLGHYLGEFVLTRERVHHSAPGIGATKSSTAIASKAK